MFASPALVLITAYVVLDPFKIIRHYDDYSIRSPGPMLNRDRISTEKFLADNPRLGFDSFIFGNSRSLAFLCSDWKTLKPGISPFHFDATAENLYGIAKKLEFLDRHGAPIRNVLLVCDAELLGGTADVPGHLFIKDHRVTGSSSLKYHLTFLRAWFIDFFFVRYLDFALSGRFKSTMKRYFEEREVIYVPDTNDNLLPTLEREVSADPAAYRESRIHIFYQRDSRQSRTSPPAITCKGKALLEHVRGIAARHRTDFKIVISPLYHQSRLNPEDIAILQAIFGAANVFDFSGVNEFTNNIENYYEASHYRPHVGRQILERICRP